MPDRSVNCCITSPPYFGLRDYGVDGQIGMGESPDAYVAKLVEVFREVRRILRDDGTLWLNLGDSYAGSRGAQSREHAGKHAPNVSAIRANQVKAGQKRSGTGSLSRTPGLKNKDLIGIPWMAAFALRADGWYLRNDIIWHKPNPMPSSVTDRFTSSHEHVFLLSKSPKYYFDQKAVAEPSVTGDLRRPYGSKGMWDVDGRPESQIQGGELRKQDGAGNANYTGFNGRYEHKPMRNKRDVWTIAPRPFKGAHFATFPPALIEPMVKAGCPAGGVVLDPFFGSGTVGLVSEGLGRRWLGVELNPEYVKMAEARIATISAVVS